MTTTFFQDEDFQDLLVALLCRDLETLRSCFQILTAKDFQPMPGQKDGRNRWLTAAVALSFFQRCGEPVDRLLKSELLAYTKSIGTPERHVHEAVTYAEQVRKVKLIGISSIVDRVLVYKRERMKAQAIDELIEARAAGELTDEKWMEVTHKATSALRGDCLAIDYFSDEELARRIMRRSSSESVRTPFLLIDPFDILVRAIGRGHLGLVLAPWKRGKSLLLEWIALAYTIQRLNVLYFTLEDPIAEVEDRFDAAVTHLPFSRLVEMPNKLRHRFEQFRRLARSRLRLVDGTQGDISLTRMEQIYLRERDRGFRAHAVIVDYDDEIVTETRKERRFELADIYRGLRKFAGKHQAIVWTAAQTQRETESLKIIGGSKAAEDISKIRKATMTIGMGQGDWGPESIYLNVAAHKFDRMLVGCNIMSDKKRMLIYDRERTREQLAKEAHKHKAETEHGA